MRYQMPTDAAISAGAKLAIGFRCTNRSEPAGDVITPLATMRAAESRETAQLETRTASTNANTATDHRAPALFIPREIRRIPTRAATITTDTTPAAIQPVVAIASRLIPCGLTVGRSAASRASAASDPSEARDGESAGTPCWAAASLYELFDHHEKGEQRDRAADPYVLEHPLMRISSAGSRWISGQAAVEAVE